MITITSEHHHGRGWVIAWLRVSGRTYVQLDMLIGSAGRMSSLTVHSMDDIFIFQIHCFASFLRCTTHFRIPTWNAILDPYPFWLKCSMFGAYVALA